MNKKVIKYTIMLLLIPVVISTIISIVQYTQEEEREKTSNNYDGINIPTYSNTQINETKRSSTYVYASVFTLLVIAGGVWIYIKKKEEF